MASATEPPGWGPIGTPDGPVIAIVGATATGKSAVSLAVARLLDPHGAEVINADSMQFYRGMDIGTAKLLPRERQGVPHHQFDTLDVHEDASVARFQADARADVDSIRRRGRVPLVVGGSGLYLRAFLDLFDFPGTDPEVRAGLEARAASEGPGLLYAELAAKDPAAAAKIHPRNAKRIVRALEIIEVAGEYTSSLPRYEYAFPAVQVGLDVPFDVLDERIDARVDAMFDAGLVDEVRVLVEAGLRDGVTARRAVGYAEILAMLDGEIDESEARAAIARHTRRLARRQRRWFGPDARVTWIAGPGAEASVEEVARRVLEAARDTASARIGWPARPAA